MMGPHIHKPDDGRGMRLVTLNGEPIQHCVYADTKRGVVIAHVMPLTLNRRGDCIQTRRMKGRVVVEVVQ